MVDENYMVYSVVASASLSLLSCILLIAAIIIVRDFESLSYKLIAYLSITDMITSISFLLPVIFKYQKSVCVTQGFMLNYGVLASFVYSSIILHYLKWCIVYEKQQTRSLEIIYNVFGWGFPAILSAIPLITDSYKSSGHWCWFESQGALNIFYQIMEGYGIGLIILCFNVHSLVCINRKLKKEILLDSQGENIRKRLMNRMVYYPFVILICIIPAAINRIILYLGKESLVLQLMAANTQCLMGFGNCIVYGFTDNLKKKLRRRYNDWTSKLN